MLKFIIIMADCHVCLLAGETQDSQEFSPSCSDRCYVPSPNCFTSKYVPRLFFCPPSSHVHFILPFFPNGNSHFKGDLLFNQV